MKQTINLGSYGWQHGHWLKTFYPDDLPEDWRLSFYSNEFNTVLVPVDYWQSVEIPECEEWIDGVHAGFHFFIECHSRMFDKITPADLTEALNILKPQLSGLVFLEDRQVPGAMSGSVKDQFSAVIDALAAKVFAIEQDSESQEIWQPGRSQDCTLGKEPHPKFAFIEDVLTDLRSTRALIEPFTRQLSDAEEDAGEATLIVNHPQLQIADLAKLRSVLEIMGH